jgi:signal peptidase I
MGVYFAENCSKSDEYVSNTSNNNQTFFIIVSRVVMGRFYRTDVEEIGRRTAPEGYDSVVFENKKEGYTMFTYD